MRIRGLLALAVVLVGVVMATGVLAVDAEPLDINSASPEELKTLPGMTEGLVLMITGGRPYQNTDELVSRRILSKEQFDQIKGSIAAKAVKKPKGP